MIKTETSKKIVYFVVSKAVLDVLDCSRTLDLVTEVESAIVNEEILLIK